MREISYIQAINEALREEMARDERVFLIGESIQSHVFFITQGLVEEFGPDRVMDTTIAETALAGAGIGSAGGIEHGDGQGFSHSTSPLTRRLSRKTRPSVQSSSSGFPI